MYIFGEDTLRSREYLREAVEQFKKQRDPKGYNVLILDAKKITGDKLGAEINTAPFLSEKRLVVVENLLSSNDKEFLKSFAERLKAKKIPESTVLICWQGEALSKVKEARELHGELQKEKYAREFPALTGGKLVEWINKTVTDAGGEIENTAAVALASGVGGNMWLLSSLINQLCAFSKGRKIAQSDVAIFVDEKIDDNVFNLVDAVVSGNHKTAFKLLMGQRELGEEDGKLFGLFLWQFRILLQISDILEREGDLTSDEVAKRLKIHPFVARKNFAIAKRYSLSKLENIYNSMLETDRKIKTGAADQAALLDLFIAKI